MRSKLISDLIKLFKIFRLVLLTNKKYEAVLLQRSTAIKELVDLDDAKLREGLVGVVFSRDRAFQLDALLESYLEKVANPADLIIIYKATNSSHQLAYCEVMERYRASHLKIEFIKQVNGFRDCLLKVLKNIEVQSIFFLVDDIIFIDSLDLSIYKDIKSRGAILSLRLSPDLKSSYTASLRHCPPQLSSTTISSQLLEFKWFEQGCEWSDPWSVDGNIYSTAEIAVLSRVAQFSAPNSYEDSLKSFADLAKDRPGYCFRKSKIINLAINRVQSEINNLSGNVHPEFLLDQWNQGLKMDRSMFEGYIPLSTHEVHVIEFRSRF